MFAKTRPGKKFFISSIFWIEKRHIRMQKIFQKNLWVRGLREGGKIGIKRKIQIERYL